MLDSCGVRRHELFIFVVMTHVDICCGANFRSRRVAFPWSEVFDVFQSRGGLDPLESLRDCDSVHVTKGKFLYEELLYSYNGANKTQNIKCALPFS